MLTVILYNAALSLMSIMDFIVYIRAAYPEPEPRYIFRCGKGADPSGQQITLSRKQEAWGWAAGERELTYDRLWSLIEQAESHTTPKLDCWPEEWN